MKPLLAVSLKLCVFCILTLPIEVGMLQRAQGAREAATVNAWRETSKDEYPSFVRVKGRTGRTPFAAKA